MIDRQMHTSVQGIRWALINGRVVLPDRIVSGQAVVVEEAQVVALDEACRRQQVGEGHFASLDLVPTQAVSLTIPALLRADHVLAVVPEARKAKAVQAALTGPVSAGCPASILRTQPHAKLFLDPDSAGLLPDSLWTNAGTGFVE